MANEVRMEKLDGAWSVFVVEDGQTSQRTFETKQFAKTMQPVSAYGWACWLPRASRSQAKAALSTTTRCSRGAFAQIVKHSPHRSMIRKNIVQVVRML
jgi:hypothetical protein